jgi:hypothetical protein
MNKLYDLSVSANTSNIIYCPNESTNSPLPRRIVRRMAIPLLPQSRHRRWLDLRRNSLLRPRLRRSLRRPSPSVPLRSDLHLRRVEVPFRHEHVPHQFRMDPRWISLQSLQRPHTRDRSHLQLSLRSERWVEIHAELRKFTRFNWLDQRRSRLLRLRWSSRMIQVIPHHKLKPYL